MSQRAKSSLKAVASYALIIFITLAAAEILARIWDWSPRLSDNAVDDGLGRWRYGHAYEGYGDLVAKQDGYWITWWHRPYHVETNSVGFRNSEEPSDKAFRILALGDSQTFGPYLTNEDTWPAWTENYLRQRYRDAGKLQMFNAGIAGYTILDELAYLKQKGLAFTPKLILLAAFENDIFDLRSENNNQVRRPTRKPPNPIEGAFKEVTRKSALTRVFDDIRNRFKLAAVGADPRRGEGAVGTGASQLPADIAHLTERYRQLFRETVELIRQRGTAFAVVFIPDADTVGSGKTSELEPVLRSLTQETGTPYLDMTETFRSEPEAFVRLYLLQRDAAGKSTGNGHLSREGNAVIGKRVAGWLTEMRLVPR